METNWMQPSQLSQVVGACDPASLVDRNFALIAAHWGLSLLATADDDDSGAPGAVQANFDTVAAARSLMLYPVANSADPEAACQANFEAINAAW